jgi:UDP-N-acetyl-D-galactosamine dehydrogenase
MAEKIAVIGLGYVGLPLAIALFDGGNTVVGYDTNVDRVLALKSGYDKNGEVSGAALQSAQQIDMVITSDEADLGGCNVFIVCVPTPVDHDRNPDLSMLVAASALVGRHVPRGGLVIWESTVYPGVTEDVCVFAVISTARHNDFDVAYSPERVNPGDMMHTLATVTKVVGANTPSAQKRAGDLYRSVAPTVHMCSIKEAEACKLLENAQRDVNIALMNEFSIACGSDVDMQNVLDACGTKWNFASFYPGLVGGHCIAVDPLFFVDWARKVMPDQPLVVEAARSRNDGMADYIVERVRDEVSAVGGNVLCLGAAFKPNVRDTRNSMALAIASSIEKCYLYDPVVCPDALQENGFYPLDLASILNIAHGLTAVVVLCAHSVFRSQLPTILEHVPDGTLFADVEGHFQDIAPDRLQYWSL